MENKKKTASSKNTLQLRYNLLRRNSSDKSRNLSPPRTSAEAREHSLPRVSITAADFVACEQAPGWV